MIKRIREFILSLVGRKVVMIQTPGPVFRPIFRKVQQNVPETSPTDRYR